MKLLKIILGFLVFILISSSMAETISHFSLYSDKRGKQIGDVITVLVTESSKASNESGTQTDKSNGAGASGEAGSGLLSFIPSFGFGTSANSNFKGSGETKRQGTLTAKLTAKIIEVDDNGNLLIKGSKIVEINNEKELLEVSGTIRQEDVSSDNTVYSFNIADAKIVYSGHGSVYTGQRPGVIARFFNWLL